MFRSYKAALSKGLSRVTVQPLNLLGGQEVHRSHSFWCCHVALFREDPLRWILGPRLTEGAEILGSVFCQASRVYRLRAHRGGWRRKLRRGCGSVANLPSF